MGKMRAAWSSVAALALSICLVACGGGGTSSSGTSSGSDSDFGTAVTLQLSPDLPAVVGASSKTEVKILAVDAKGATRDVTAVAQVHVDSPNRLTTAVSGSNLQLQFLQNPGSVTVHTEALGLSLDKSVWVTSSVPPTAQVQRVDLTIGEGYASLTPNADGSLSLLPWRDLLIQATVFFDGGTSDITGEAQITSLSGSVVSVQPVINPDGNIPWWFGRTLTPGTSTLKLRWAGFQATRVINVSTGFVLQGGWADQGGVTENAAGRTTAYMQIGNDLSTRQLAYVESAGGNQWSAPVVLPSPASQFPILARTLPAESPNGYRATLTGNSLNEGWVYLIGPGGEVKGPTIVTDGTNGTNLLRITVTADGNAHVWLLDRLGVTRRIVRFSDGQASTVSTMPLTFADVYAIPQVAVASDGTVGLAWTDTSCNVHFAFDDLANSGPAGPGSGGSARISECSAQYFANIFTKFDIGSGAGELAVVITYGTGFNATTTDVMNVGRGGIAKMTLLARDTTVTAGSPRIGMASSGEFVAIWPTESRGVWGVHRAVAAPSPESPFLVEAPFFSLGTPAVEGVHPRGDGRFLLVWPGGSSAQRTPLEMRNYAGATGLGDRMSFPYQNSSATNSTTLIATPYGVSAAWDFRLDLSIGEFDAMQWFLP
jgi:hypothetical protein